MSATVAPARIPGGWNVIGYHHAELGLGDAGRRVARALRATGLPLQLVATNTPFAPQQQWLERDVSTRITFRDSIVAVNADQALDAMFDAGELDNLGGRRVGVWFWELSTFPDRFSNLFTRYDEIWVASAFMQSAIASQSPIPVRRFTLEIPVRSEATCLRRRDVDLDDRFTFLVKFDWQSVVRRKNPTDAIAAYRSAFRPAGTTRLIIRSVNAASFPDDFAALVDSCGDRDDISVVDGWMSPSAMDAQLRLVDCYVSLHRSEGFGLNIANAVASGTPVVATGYSGNLDFMDESSSWLIPYDLVPVGPGAAPYDGDAHWAQPDVEAAARAMRDVADHRDSGRQRALAARDHVSRTHSAEVAAASLLRLINELCERTEERLR